jgi:hypothetical protein
MLTRVVEHGRESLSSHELDGPERSESRSGTEVHSCLLDDGFYDAR